MLLEIDHHSGVPIYRQINDQVRHQILAGQLKEGKQLVSVRELAARIAVNPMTVSKAYAMLENEGFLERQRGIGLFVAKLRSEHKQQTQAAIIKEILKQAAVTAIQFGIPESQLQEILSKLYEKYGS